MGTGVIAGANATDIAVNCGPCGNETGNGNEIIQGPDGPAGADSGRVFRSLTVHPSDPETTLMGTELGYTSEDIEPGTDTAVFQPDLDPSTQTDPLNPDSDGNRFKDGLEDANLNGRVDSGESDPNVWNLRAMPWVFLLLLQ